MFKFARPLILLWLSLSAFCMAAQRETTQEQLAMQYLGEKEFEKAAVYLELLYDRNPDRWYADYYRSLLETKKYGQAEKLVKKQIRRHRNDVYLYVHLGKVYQRMGEVKKEQDAYSRALKDLIPVQPYLPQLAQAFAEEKLYDRSLEVYDKGRKANPDYPFFYERAEIYKAKGDLAAMIGEYLDALEYRESELGMVQGNLQNSLGYDDKDGGFNNPVLKTELQKRIAKNPGKIVLVEFLIFIQKQQKDFEGAFMQARALDKRLREEGQRIYELATLCADNGQWETARRCYDYLLAKGSGSPYFDVASIEGLNVEFQALTAGAQPPAAELAALENRLRAAYDKYRHLTLSYQLLKNLVTVQAYYLGKGADAIATLEQFITQPGIDPQAKADFKLLLGDLYLVSGAIWDASLLYSQVEKDFKYETIGQEAKFRNARLSYYAGDFRWAKTQCDVLKGATSKLIANDALDLSLVITDAIGVDTNAAPLKMFSSAELLVRQHRYTEAVARMDSINLQFSAHTLGDDILFKKASLFVTLGRYAEAEKMYRDVLEYYPGDLYGDDAQFRLAELYDVRMGERDKARQAYEDVLVRYPGSIFTVEARKRYRQLRGDMLNN